MHFSTVKGILSPHNGLNLYRGCTHGCIYCDSRSDCYGFNHAFEDVEVKQNAIELLDAKLRSKRKKCMIGMGSMTDPYLPLEKELCHTQKALQVALKYGFGVTLITKSDLILRDLDLLKAINQKAKCVVQITLTTFDESLCKVLEPNVCTTQRRFEVLLKLKEEGIPTVVWLSPILPFVNDTEQNINGILDYCVAAKVYGIICFGMGLTLRDGNREYFYSQLDKYFPSLKQKYMRIYGDSYEVGSLNSAKLMKLFNDKCEKYGIVHDNFKLFEYLNELPSKNTFEQLDFFG